MTKEKRRKELEKELKRIVKILVKNYQPEKIILFGSLAGGRIHQWSDLDVVVIKETKKRFAERAGEVSAAVPHNVPLDFIVYTPNEFKEMTSYNYIVRDEIIKKGRVVYEKI
jgi:predicted nucleotidyltransferase